MDDLEYSAEERAFLRALAAYFPRETTGREREITWEELARTARALLASVGALSVPGEAPTKGERFTSAELSALMIARARLVVSAHDFPKAEDRDDWNRAADRINVMLGNRPHFAVAAALAAPPPEKEPGRCGKGYIPSECDCDCGDGPNAPKEPPAPREFCGICGHPVHPGFPCPPNHLHGTWTNAAPAETRSVERELGVLRCDVEAANLPYGLSWSDRIENTLRLYRAEKEASARLSEMNLAARLATKERMQAEVAALRAERDAALLDSKESMTLYRQNRARLEAERDDLAKRIEEARAFAKRTAREIASHGSRNFVQLWRDYMKILDGGGSSGKGDR